MNRRTVVALILALILLFSMATPSYADTVKGTITGSYVNVRSGPGTTYEVIGGFARGAQVSIVETVDGWCTILFGGEYGYVSADYVEINTPSTEESTTTPSDTQSTTEPPVSDDTTSSEPPKEDAPIIVVPEGTDPNTGRIISPVVNMRSGPAVNYTVVTLVTLYEEIVILERLDEWYKVRFGELEGYIYSEHIRDYAMYVTVEPEPEPEPLPEPEPGTDVTTAPESTDASSEPPADTGSETTAPDSAVGSEGETGTTEPPALSDTSETEPEYVQPVVVRHGVVKANLLNLREGPSSTSTLKGTLSHGDIVTILGEEGAWYKVQVGTNAYYAAKSYIEIRAALDPAEDIMVGSVDAYSLNVRIGPSTVHFRIATISRGDRMKITDVEDGWYKIEIDDQIGYVSAEYVETVYDPANPPADPDIYVPPIEPPHVDLENPIDSGISIVDTTLRILPDVESEKLAQIPKGTFADIYEEVDGWYVIVYGETSGYVSTEDFINGVYPYRRPASAPQKGANRVSELSSDETFAPSVPYDPAAGAEIVAFAKTLMGIPYVYGGATPEDGFDCSGFTMYVYNSVGYDMPRLQQYLQGVEIAYEDMQPGDLVAFSTNGYAVGHVGIYIGNGEFIHSPNSGSTVSIAKLTSGYYFDRFVTARRLSK
ncbi:MAG: SH3 domain-containing protein [Clostridia bacterium]|nr:SH3 domain-containing protein [Clostridia bacterium]